jgi:hypothetical protein
MKSGMGRRGAIQRAGDGFILVTFVVLGFLFLGAVVNVFPLTV